MGVCNIWQTHKHQNCAYLKINPGNIGTSDLGVEFVYIVLW